MTSRVIPAYMVSIVLLLLSLSMWSCRTSRGQQQIETRFAADTTGFWKNVRSFRLANGAMYHDLIDSTHQLARYTLLFADFRSLLQFEEAPAAEMALRWLLDEPTAEHQPTLGEDIRKLGGSLEINVFPDAVGLQVTVPSDHLLSSVQRLLNHLAAPRWQSNRYYRTRDQMAAERVALFKNEAFVRTQQAQEYFWGRHPYGSTPSGSYDQLMKLRADDIRAAYRRLWFYGPKVHILSSGAVPDYESLYTLLETIPHRAILSETERLSPDPETRFQVKQDTSSAPQLYGSCVLERNEVLAEQVDLEFWTYAIENIWNAELCQKRYLTCSFGGQAHVGPSPQVLMLINLYIPNTTSLQAARLMERMTKAGRLSPSEFLQWKRAYLLDWYISNRSPHKRHQMLADAASRRQVGYWVQTPQRLAHLSIKQFLAHHEWILKNLFWLYIGQAAELEASTIQYMQGFPHQ